MAYCTQCMFHLNNPSKVHKTLSDKLLDIKTNLPPTSSEAIDRFIHNLSNRLPVVEETVKINFSVQPLNPFDLSWTISISIQEYNNNKYKHRWVYSEEV